MEKLLYPIWKPTDENGTDFRRRLVEALVPLLADQSGVRYARISVVDEDVAPAAPRRMESCRPTADGMLSLWVDNAAVRSSWEQPLEALVERMTAYQVVESEPLVNQEHAAGVGERVHGMCQVVFLSIPPRLSRAEWLEVWQGSHGQIAIDTQSTFGYRQNVIVRPLSYAAPPFDAIIEENFPPEAMASDHAFYGAGDDDDLLARHQRAMIDSCVRFIDFDKIDCLPMSEYRLK